MRKEAPLWWFNKSSDLRASAGTLWLGMTSEQSENTVRTLNLGDGFSIAAATWPVYEMLCGMSLELIFKAVAVVKGSDPTAIHKLTNLAKEAGLTYSKDVEGILDIWTESIVWNGRYPVPKKEEAMARTQELRREHLYVGGKLSGVSKKYNDSLSWESFNSIWSVANNEFWKHYS
jgi:hypothetical protein